LKQFWILIFFCGAFGSLDAQEKEVLFRGRVTDKATGETLPLCHLWNLNTKQAYYTDISGFFSIKVKENDPVQVTFIGYKTQVVKYMPGSEMLEVKMEPIINYCSILLSILQIQRNSWNDKED